VTSNLSSTLLKQGRNHRPSMQAVLVIFIALFVLFLWFTFVLNQEIESIGRQIQERTDELRANERRREAILKEISASESQRDMSRRAEQLGYQPQVPIYLPVTKPLAGARRDGPAHGFLDMPTSGQEWPALGLETGWDLLVHQSDVYVGDTAP
jgi:cell division protein FtsB